MISLMDYSRISKKEIKDKSVVILDVDETIVEGRIAKSAFYLLEEEKNNGNWFNYFRGTVGGAKIIIGTKLRSRFEDAAKVENDGLKSCMKILHKAKIVKRRVHDSAKRYTVEHAVSGAYDLLDTLNGDYGMKIHFSSLTGDGFLDPLADERNATYTSQEMIYDENEIPYDVNFRIKSAFDKLIETEKDLLEMGFSLKDSIYIGDSDTDRFFAKSNNPAGIFICSPLTTSKELREISRIKLNGVYDYNWLNEELKNLA